MVSESQFAFLRSIDTPTVCNLIEIVAPERRGSGYTVVHLHCPFPDLPPMVGFAKTVTIRSRDAVGGPSYMQKRMDYLDYVAAEPRPSVVLIQDLDEPPGYGAFWGEVQTNVHKALGCLGTVTNGSVRDIPAIENLGFQVFAGGLCVSHAYVHIVEFGTMVEIGGLKISSGDLLHGDLHGVQNIPLNLAEKIPAAAAEIAAQEKALIELCQSKDFSPEKLRAAIGKTRF
jgi:regulator of RNase E activity RraA